MVELYRRKVAAMAIALAKEDPEFLKEVIRRLEAAGEIEPGELAHLERIADRWIAIARVNAAKGRA